MGLVLLDFAFSFVVSDRIFEEWRSLASTQAIKAAARTAVVLHAVAIHVILMIAP